MGETPVDITKDELIYTKEEAIWIKGEERKGLIKKLLFRFFIFLIILLFYRWGFF